MSVISDEIYAVLVNENDNYAISNYGNVLNIKKQKLLTPRLSKNGYYFVSLCGNSIESQYKVHRLIALYFIPNFNNYSQIDHIDNNRQNNNINNLRWCNQSQNERNKPKRQNCTSIYKGVCFDISRNKYVVKIKVSNKHHFLGRFNTEREAGIKWNEFVIEHKLKEFYTLNNIV